MKKIILFFVTLILFLFSLSVAQTLVDTTAGSPKVLIDVPAGFDWWYVGVFVIGMVIHFWVKVVHDLGWSGLLKNLIGNFAGWFINKFHWTLLGGAATAVIALAANYAPQLSFGSLNLLGIIISVAAGYIGDSAFNSGTIVRQT